ncbi:MAG: hypothetical protein ACR2IH_07930 [Pyrinomonadaceae bacterium]
MNIIKLILSIIGLFFGLMVFFWVLGIVSSLLWYGLIIGVLAAVSYSGYSLFIKAENKFVGPGTGAGQIDARDYNMSWEDYERKYLNK